MSLKKTIKIGSLDVEIPTGLFIGGEWVSAKGGKTFGVENPATGEEIIQVAEGEAEDVDVAVRVARKTFKSKAWREYDVTQRAAALHRLADLMEKHKEALLQIECLDTGRLRSLATNVDIPASIGTLRYYAGWADKVEGLTSFNIPKLFAYTKREPVGVCGQIIPWNFPLLMFTWKIAPAFACGNTVVIKSAEVRNNQQ